jgi:hypothetical protein
MPGGLRLHVEHGLHGHCNLQQPGLRSMHHNVLSLLASAGSGMQNAPLLTRLFRCKGFQAAQK